MYPNQAFSSGSYMDMFTSSPLLPYNYYNESVAEQNGIKFNMPIGDTVTMQSIDEHSNAYNSHVDEQSIQCQELSLRLGTLLPSNASVPPFQYQYNDTGFVSLMNACRLPKGTTIANEDELKSSECMESISSRGFHDTIKRDCFRNPHSSDQCLPGSQGFSNIFLNTQYLKAIQELLDEIVNVRKQRGMEKQETIRNIGLDNPKDSDGKSISQSMQITSGGPNDPNSNPSCEISSAERQNLLDKKTKLLSMLDEVDKRYRQYCHRMQIVVSSLDMVAGGGAAEPYTTLALRTISRQFRCLRDAISNQVQVIQRNLGEQEGIPRLRYVDQQLRQQKALQHLGVMRQAWRPQRGLPENSVSILRAWLFEHFLNPYPKDSEKIMLARQTGLTRNQVANWFINARVRLWKPMVEEIYKEEFGGSEMNCNFSSGNTLQELGNFTTVESGGHNNVSLALELRNCESDGLATSDDDAIHKRHNNNNNQTLVSSSQSTDLLDYHFTDSGKQQHMFGNTHLLHEFVV
ncbi:putative transcription factor Homeodomain-TALE-BEL family [Medicago truncatula]|uniref:Putative transcription factor Homeodomain-TALE-BEL family n=1 Tax=Medicago truncatula TaxID=3880 RepID=A0A396IZS7_MEDTR|nr:BEL1-like homeodomain protein 10 isoform X2 [Medicago truncatula]RHN71040.1 putative transcription factor Homeodomain-TALE-BEL family [Medicago truncatula]